MAQHDIDVQWMGKMQFNALVNGHTVIMDSPVRVGGEDHGPIPKPFILTALAGCTGMDVIALLRKSGLSITDFNIHVTGELSKGLPMQYVSMHIVYYFLANDLVKDEVLQAVADSQEKYCGVSAMLKKALPVTWEINFNSKTVFNNREESAKIIV